MIRKTLFTAALASAIGLVAMGAEAQDRAPVERMSAGQIAAMLEGQGYTVHEIELEHGRYEVEMIDANGMRTEAYLDAATGEVLPYRDDDRRDYRGRDDDHAWRGLDRDHDARYRRDHE